MRLIPVRAPNTCGGCTLCCKVLKIVELDKPKDQWCSHAIKGQGCGIYETRPPTCRTYNCLWLSLNLPPTLRPDKIHGVLSAMSSGENVVLFEDPGYPGQALKALLPWMQSFTQSGERFVLVVTGNQKQFVAREDLFPRLSLAAVADVPDAEQVLIAPK